MSLIPVLLALLPVIVIFLLLVLKKSAADTAGFVGWVVVVAVACLAFRTPLSVVLRSSLGGLVASFPISLVVATSIFQVTLLAETGALARVIALIKTVSPENKAVQIMLINIGIGTLLTALGAVPVSILPPIMLALGYSSFAAIALPAIGYDALCTYALLGIPIVVFANFVGRPVAEVGHYFARFMPAISTCIALGMLWLAGKGKLLRKGALPALIAGLTAGFTAIGMNAVGLVTLTGIAAGIAVILTMSVFLLVTGRKLIDRSVLTPADLEAEGKMSLATAFSPWIILVVCALLVNAPFLPFLNLTFKKLEMALPIIPGAPKRSGYFGKPISGSWSARSSPSPSSNLRRPNSDGRSRAGGNGPRGRSSPRRSFSPSPSSSTTAGRTKPGSSSTRPGTWSMSWPERPSRPLDGYT